MGAKVAEGSEEVWEQMQQRWKGAQASERKQSILISEVGAEVEKLKL